MLDDIGRSSAERVLQYTIGLSTTNTNPAAMTIGVHRFRTFSFRENTRKGGCRARYCLGRQHIQRYERDELGNEKQHVRMLGVILLENLIREHKGGPET
jgi:hypothetical protein